MLFLETISHPKIIHYADIHVDTKPITPIEDFEPEEEIIPFNQGEDFGDLAVPYKRNKKFKTSGPVQEDPWHNTGSFEAYFPLLLGIVLSSVCAMIVCNFVKKEALVQTKNQF